MKSMTDSGRLFQPVTGQIHDTAPVQANQEIVFRITGLIQFGTWLLSALLVLRYALEQLQASPRHPFANLIYLVSEPFLSVFEGLTRAPVFRDVALELNTLMAVAIYSLLGWIAIRLIRILFASPN